MVYNARLGGGVKKAIALKMADCASDAGTSIWPSLDTIAFDTEVPKRTAQRAIKGLVESGLLVVTKQGGGRNVSTEYRFDMFMLERLAIEGKKARKPRHSLASINHSETTPPDGAVCKENMANGATKPRQSLATEPSIEPSKKERGTLLPSDWHLPSEWRQWAHGKSPAHSSIISNEAEKFQNYFRRKRKVDWEATWRNWWLTTIQRDPPKRSGRPLGHAPRTTQHDTSKPFSEYMQDMIDKGMYHKQ